MSAARAGRAPGPVAVSRGAAARFLLWHQGLLDADGLAEALGGSGSGGPAASSPWRGELRGVEGALTALRRLEAVQIDPVAVVAPNHHLVLRARVGGYRPSYLEALFARQAVCEYYLHARCFLPLEDFPLGAPRMARVAARHRARYPELEAVKRAVLARMRAEGPLPARAFESEKVTGFWGTPMKATSLAIDLLWDEGRLMVAARDGGERHFDVAERLLPEAVADELRALRRRPVEAHARGALKQLRTEGLVARPGGWLRRPAAERKAWTDAQLAAGVIREVAIEGVRRRYHVLAEQVPALLAMEPVRARPRVHLLAPLDNLMWSRPRLADVFGFDYRWEIYTPAKQRRYGAYTMPVLEGDRFAGRVDARANRGAGRLEVAAVHWEDGVPVGPRREARVARALDDLARWLGLGDGVALGPGRSAPNSALLY